MYYFLMNEAPLPQCQTEWREVVGPYRNGVICKRFMKAITKRGHYVKINLKEKEIWIKKKREG